MTAKEMISEAQFMSALRSALTGIDRNAPYYAIGTITSLTPLRILEDGAKTPVPCSTLTFYVPVIGDRVVYTKFKRQILVHGTTTTAALTVIAGAYLADANNLSDVPNKVTARGNLGLGTAATANASDFDAAGAAGAAALLLLDLAGTKAMTGALNMNSHKVTSLTPGSASTDAATVGQMPTLASFRAMIILGHSYSAGTGVNAPDDATKGMTSRLSGLLGLNATDITSFTTGGSELTRPEAPMPPQLTTTDSTGMGGGWGAIFQMIQPTGSPGEAFAGTSNRSYPTNGQPLSALITGVNDPIGFAKSTPGQSGFPPAAGNTQGITGSISTGSSALACTTAGDGFYVGVGDFLVDSTGTRNYVASVNATGTTINFSAAWPGAPVSSAPCYFRSDFSAGPLTVTNKALTTNVATLTIGTHPMVVGQGIVVTGVDSTFNGRWTLTSVSSTTVSYALTHANVASVASGGTVMTGGINAYRNALTAVLSRLVAGTLFPSTKSVDEVLSASYASGVNTITVQAPAPAVTNCTYAGATGVTITYSSTTGFVVGQQITVSGIAGITNVNGTWLVTSVSGSTSLTFTPTSTPTGAYTSGGTVTAQGIATTDVGRPMWGPGIPIGSYIATVSGATCTISQSNPYGPVSAGMTGTAAAAGPFPGAAGYTTTIVAPTTTVSAGTQIFLGAITAPGNTALAGSGTWTPHFTTQGNSGPGYFANATAGGTITITLPSDFPGGTIAVCFLGTPPGDQGAFGVNWSGTASVIPANSTVLSAQGAAGNYVPVVQRISGLVAADAGKTIVATSYVTTAGVAPLVMFDSWWREADFQQPVVMTNIPRYAYVQGTSGFGAGNHSSYARPAYEIPSLNAAMSSVASTFGANVVICDMDSVLNPRGGAVQTAASAAATTLLIAPAAGFPAPGTAGFYLACTPNSGTNVAPLMVGPATNFLAFVSANVDLGGGVRQLTVTALQYALPLGSSVWAGDLMALDNIHPDQVGHAVWATEIYKTIQSTYTGLLSPLSSEGPIGAIAQSNATLLRLRDKPVVKAQDGWMVYTPATAISTASALVANTEWAVPFYVPEPCILTGVGVEVFSQSSGTPTMIYMGLYGGESKPETLAADLGKFTTGVTTGDQPLVGITDCWQILQPGIWWLAPAVSNVGTGAPHLVMQTASALQVPVQPTATPTISAGTIPVGYVQTTSSSLASFFYFDPAKGHSARANWVNALSSAYVAATSVPRLWMTFRKH